MKMKLRFLTTCVLGLLASCEEQQPPTIETFEQPVIIDLQDVTTESGLDFVSTSGRLPTTRMATLTCS
jgi:hypothetical protein